jgi:hypothetical protein
MVKLGPHLSPPRGGLYLEAINCEDRSLRNSVFAYYTHFSVIVNTFFKLFENKFS